MQIWMWLLLLIITICIIGFIVIYNQLIRLRNQVDEAWSDIDVQLKRRYDLIPNLLSCVKGYKAYEADTLKQITELRQNAQSADTVGAKGKAEAALTLGLGRLFAVAENYPDLKANASFIDLQKNLSDLENQIQNARRYYNGVTREYNAKIQSVPEMLIANWFHFTARDFFGLDAASEKAVPQVKF